MNICVPTCNRAEMAARLAEKLPVKLFVNNCDVAPYLLLNAEIEVIPIDGDPVQCSNEAFRYIIQTAPLDDDLLIIEDDTEPCEAFLSRLKLMEYFADGFTLERRLWRGKFTINPLYCPERRTKYTAAKEEMATFSILVQQTGETKYFQMQVQNWVDTNLFIPKALLPEMKGWFKDPVPIRKQSNGIGYHISQKMYKNGYPMFTCVPSLLGHGDHDSIIYPEGRKRVPLIAKI